MSNTKVNASLIEGYSVLNATRGHEWNADEPIELGGEDTGPKPTELLLSSLASCKIITVKMYAERKGWDLKNIDVDLEIVEVGEITLIKKTIGFEGELSIEQKNRLIEISGRCPVVRMLKSSVKFIN